MKDNLPKVEERAPAIILSGEVGKTEEFKRPAHPDFMDSSELKEAKWSGVRYNSLAGTLEIWKYGVLAASMHETIARKYPGKWIQLYKDTFDLF